MRPPRKWTQSHQWAWLAIFKGFPSFSLLPAATQVNMTSPRSVHRGKSARATLEACGSGSVHVQRLEKGWVTFELTLDPQEVSLADYVELITSLQCLRLFLSFNVYPGPLQGVTLGDKTIQYHIDKAVFDEGMCVQQAWDEFRVTRLFCLPTFFKESLWSRDQISITLTALGAQSDPCLKGHACAPGYPPDSVRFGHKDSHCVVATPFPVSVLALMMNAVLFSTWTSLQWSIWDLKRVFKNGHWFYIVMELRTLKPDTNCWLGYADPAVSDHVSKWMSLIPNNRWRMCMKDWANHERLCQEASQRLGMVTIEETDLADEGVVLWHYLTTRLPPDAEFERIGMTVNEMSLSSTAEFPPPLRRWRLRESVAAHLAHHIQYLQHDGALLMWLPLPRDLFRDHGVLGLLSFIYHIIGLNRHCGRRRTWRYSDFALQVRADIKIVSKGFAPEKALRQMLDADVWRRRVKTEDNWQLHLLCGLATLPDGIMADPAAARILMGRGTAQDHAAALERAAIREKAPWIEVVTNYPIFILGALGHALRKAPSARVIRGGRQGFTYTFLIHPGSSVHDDELPFLIRPGSSVHVDELRRQLGNLAEGGPDALAHAFGTNLYRFVRWYSDKKVWVN